LEKKTPKKKKTFHWTKHRKEIADLANQGKEFMEIIALGYGKNATSIVMNALKRGVKVPEHIEEGERIPEDETGEAKGKPLISGSSPKSAPIIFKLGQKEIVLDPLELHNQYRYFLDLSKRNGGITETFSEVLTLGMQVLWVLHQDIPMTENMLKAVFSK
jgi:hypothetical protein